MFALGHEKLEFEVCLHYSVYRKYVWSQKIFIQIILDKETKHLFCVKLRDLGFVYIDRPRTQISLENDIWKDFKHTTVISYGQLEDHLRLRWPGG